MVTVTLPYGYYIEVQRNRNYILYKNDVGIDKKTKEEKTITRNLGYYSDFGTAIKLGYLKDLEASLEHDKPIDIGQYVKSIEEIENRLVKDFYTVLKANISEDVLNTIKSYE